MSFEIHLTVSDVNGFISIGISYLSTALFVPFVPLIIIKLGNKLTMCIGGLCYTFYIMVYIHPTPSLLYSASVIQGLGGALLWIAQGPVLVLNSNEETMTRNSSLFWILYMLGSFGGNLFVYFKWENDTVISQTDQNAVVFTLGAFSLAGSFLFFFIRPTDGQNAENQSTREMMKSMFSVCKHKELFYLIPAMAYSGVELCFTQSLYPTCTAATKRLGADSVRLTGLSAIMSGCGEICGAIVLMLTGGDNGDNYRGYYYAIINVLATGAFFLPSLSLPGECSFADSYQTGPLRPNIGVLMTCAFVYGYFDATVNTVLTTMIGLSFTNELDVSGLSKSSYWST